MERPNTLTSETIEMVLEKLKTDSVDWPYRFHRGSPVVGCIEINDDVYLESVTMGNHCIHEFTSPGPFDEAFIRGRVTAVQELWKQELNAFCGKLCLDADCRLRMGFPGSNDDLGIHECGVCFDLTTITTNCLIDGRLNSHPLCAACMAKMDGQCPHKHDEFKGGCLGCMCCGDEDYDFE